MKTLSAAGELRRAKAGQKYPIDGCAQRERYRTVRFQRQQAAGAPSCQVSRRLSDELANVVERVGGSAISVLEGGREGVSGTIWRDGVAVTAAHTIRGRDEVTVVLSSGIEAKGSIAGRDAGTDIAVLKIPDAPAIGHLPDSMQPRVGEIVLSVARRGAEGLAATYGLISAIGGPWHTWQGARIDRWVRLASTRLPGSPGDRL